MNRNPRTPLSGVQNPPPATLAEALGNTALQGITDAPQSDAESTYAAYRAWATQPLAERPRLSIVIPAYNERERILPTIGAIATYVSSRGEPWELIIADDGSKDDTVSLINDLGLVNLRVLIAERNGGKGKAVRRGIAAAKGEYVLFADADQSTPIEQIELLLAPLLAGKADIAVGSRAELDADATRKSLMRRVMSKGLQIVVRLGFRIGVRDTQCGFKLFRADVAKDLFERQVIDGFSFDLEVLYLASKLGYRTAEVPVQWIDAPGSTVDATKVAIGFLRDLIHIRKNDLLGRYKTTPVR